MFTLTYGALVVQLIKVGLESMAGLLQKLKVQDYEDYGEVNKQLDKMWASSSRRLKAHVRGHNIGTRLIEDFLARTGLQKCSSFAETAEVVSKVRAIYATADQNSSQVAFKTFLNITPTVTAPSPSEFILTLEENPLSEFAELPRDAKEGGLWFSNVLCGVIRGALEMVN